jgi:hypothetical protein
MSNKEENLEIASNITRRGSLNKRIAVADPFTEEDICPAKFDAAVSDAISEEVKNQLSK